jgi:hypothetical protein
MIWRTSAILGPFIFRNIKVVGAWYSRVTDDNNYFTIEDHSEYSLLLTRLA